MVKSEGSVRVLRHEEGVKLKGMNPGEIDYRSLSRTGSFSFRTLVLKKGQSTRFHAHKGKEEVYVIFSGRGVAVDGTGELHNVAAGQSIFFPEGEFHSIGCPPGCERTHFLSITSPPIGRDRQFKEPPKRFVEMMNGKPKRRK